MLLGEYFCDEKNITGNSVTIRHYFPLISKKLFLSSGECIRKPLVLSREKTIAKNRKNTDRHAILFSCSLTDSAVSDVCFPSKDKSRKSRKCMQKLWFIHGKLYLFSTFCTGKVSCICESVYKLATTPKLSVPVLEFGCPMFLVDYQTTLPFQVPHKPAYTHLRRYHQQ